MAPLTSGVVIFLLAFQPAIAFQPLANRPLGGVWRRMAAVPPPPRRGICMADSSETAAAASSETKSATGAETGSDTPATGNAGGGQSAAGTSEEGGSWWDDTDVQEKLAAASEAVTEEPETDGVVAAAAASRVEGDEEGGYDMGAGMRLEAEEDPYAWADSSLAEADAEGAQAPSVQEGPPPLAWSNADFQGSEWKIGISWEGEEQTGPGRIQETWIRCNDEFKLEWGTNADGTWGVDGQFFTFTRDFLFGWGGKRIFTAALKTEQNRVYMEGLIRGWTPISPAEILGQFQAIRLGVEDRKGLYGEPMWMTRGEGEKMPDLPAGSPMPEEPFWTGATEAFGSIQANLKGTKPPEDLEG